MEMEAPTVTLTDEAGRSLDCYIKLSVEVDGEEYALLHPVDYPVDVYAWVEDPEATDAEEEEETLVPVEDEELDTIFATAQAVLAEQNLKLKRTAISLTVEGELPELNQDEILQVEMENGAEGPDLEEYQSLATFFYQEQEYEIYTPLDPRFFIARMKEPNKPELLSPEEFEKIQPILEEQLFDELD